MQRLSRLFAIACAATALILSACGGGGSSMPPLSSTLSGASAGASSSGTVTAFGSVFVNGHEFATGGARVIDDDAGTTANGTSSLEVGMSVDVMASGSSSANHPEAAEIHVHPLVRGVVDSSDPAGTITVMGQTIQLTASTVFSDHRACVSAATPPCTAVTGQSDLTATTGSGSSATPGSYVTVHGFLFASDASSGNANVVATLVSVADPPASTTRVAYKAEGVVKSVGAGSSIMIGGLTVDLSAATCRAKGATASCATAFSVGQVVSAFGAKAPALPATTFTADAALLRGKIAVETPGAVVEVEGKVSAVDTSMMSFVVRGITVDASALMSLPVVGDVVVVAGTVSDDGQSIKASAVKVIHAARAATFAFEGDASSVAAGSATDTWLLTMLGQSMTVNSSTRLRDLTMRSDPSNPFNISTFQSYLAASASQHLVVRTLADAAGNLTATSVTIVRASTVAAVSGVVDATPAPVNGSGSSAPTTFAVHGLSVSADPAAIVKVFAQHNLYGFGGMGRTAGGTVAAGDRVLVFGTFASSTLTVAAPASLRSIVLDFGAGLRDKDCDGF
ncbi:MAG: DUF5666 domain-containing protein [Burkholderiales bacterium]